MAIFLTTVTAATFLDGTESLGHEVDGRRRHLFGRLGAAALERALPCPPVDRVAGGADGPRGRGRRRPPRRRPEGVLPASTRLECGAKRTRFFVEKFLQV